MPPVLLRFGRDLTAEAEAGRLPPVVGRRDEMLQVVQGAAPADQEQPGPDR